MLIYDTIRASMFVKEAHSSSTFASKIPCEVYRQLDTPPREDVLSMISLYSIWKVIPATRDNLQNLVWYLSDDPHHISQVLSHQGRRRKLEDVAQAYIELQDIVSRFWRGTEKIESMVLTLEQGNELPPIITIPGKKYPNSPESSFIDGVHRGLAGMVYILRNHTNPMMNILSGEKENIAFRALRKLPGVKRV